MRTSARRAVAGAFALVLGSATTAQAEELEITHCYSGTVSITMKDPPALVTWSQNGIIMSAHPRKLLNNAVSHCEGVQVGGGATRVGNGFCKIVDEDGDALIFETPYTGVDIEVKLVRGTGKWQDVSGALHSTRIVRSADGKGAMPLTYQGCRLEKGEVEMRK